MTDQQIVQAVNARAEKDRNYFNRLYTALQTGNQNALLQLIREAVEWFFNVALQTAGIVISEWLIREARKIAGMR